MQKANPKSTVAPSAYNVHIERTVFYIKYTASKKKPEGRRRRKRRRRRRKEKST